MAMNSRHPSYDTIYSDALSAERGNAANVLMAARQNVEHRRRDLHRARAALAAAEAQHRRNDNVATAVRRAEALGAVMDAETALDRQLARAEVARRALQEAS